MGHPPVPQRSAKRGGPARARARAAALSGLPSTLVTHLTRDNAGFVCGARFCEQVWKNFETFFFEKVPDDASRFFVELLWQQMVGCDRVSDP